MKSFSDLAFEDYLRILRRQIWYFVITTVVIGAGVGYYAYQLPAIYRSETKIVVDAPGITGSLLGTRHNNIDNEINMVREQLTSRTILERLAEEFELVSRKGSIERAVLWLNERISVEFTKRNTFALSFSSTDPVFTRDVTKRLAEEVIRMNDSMREAQATLADQFLDEQVRQSEQELVAIEKQISAFKVKHLGELPEPGGATLNALTALNAQLAAAENALQRSHDQRALLEHKLQEEKRLALLYQTLPGADATLTRASPNVPVVREEVQRLRAELETRGAALAQLAAKYTAEHPDVVRLTREVQDLAARINETPVGGTPVSVPGSSVASTENGAASSILNEVRLAEARGEIQELNQEVARRENERESIFAQVQSYQRRLTLAPKLEQELLSLTRQHDALKQRHGNLQQQKFNTRMLASLEVNNRNPTFRIMDIANLPEFPIGPDRPMIASVGVIVGLALGIGLAFARESFDPTIRDEDEASNILQMPTLVSIPDVTVKQNGVHWSPHQGTG